MYNLLRWNSHETVNVDFILFVTDKKESEELGLFRLREF
jgi:hypothetical protein